MGHAQSAWYRPATHQNGFARLPWRGLRAALIVITLVLLVCSWPPAKQGRFARSFSFQAFAAPAAAHVLSPISID